MSHDYTKGIQIYCPVCGKKITRFLTTGKFRQCATVDFRFVHNFFTVCDACKSWIEFRRKPARSISDFKGLCASPWLGETHKFYPDVIRKPREKKSQ